MSVLALSGCGTPATQPCTVTLVGLRVGVDQTLGPGMPNHAAAPPGNQAQLVATANYVYSGTSCIISNVQAALPAQWTSSDPKNITIDSSSTPTNGLATCTGATSGPATITASYTINGAPQTGSTTLTCY